MSAPDKLYNHLAIDVRRLRMREDWVLVRPEPETHVGVLEIPEIARDARYKLHRGRVVRVGPGDTLLAYQCQGCLREFSYPRWKLGVAHERQPKCCGPLLRWPQKDRRSEMGVEVGDIVLYWEGDHQIRLDGVPYHILHEEQHIQAVIPQTRDG